MKKRKAGNFRQRKRSHIPLTERIKSKHPVPGKRASVITGKYKGGVFCKLEENLDCLCTYSPNQYDENFQIGDQVIVAITKIQLHQKQIYGKIVAKW